MFLLGPQTFRCLDVPAPRGARGDPRETSQYDARGEARLLLRKRADEIGAAHDPHNALVADNGHALDLMRGEKLADLGNIGVLGHAHDRGRHDIARRSMPVQAGNKLRAERFAFGQHRKPPVAPRQPVLGVVPQQVAFANHADNRAGLVHHRDSADAVLQQQFGDFAHGRIRAHGDNCGRHYVKCVHLIAYPVRMAKEHREIVHHSLKKALTSCEFFIIKVVAALPRVGSGGRFRGRDSASGAGLSGLHHPHAGAALR